MRVLPKDDLQVFLQKGSLWEFLLREEKTKSPQGIINHRSRNGVFAKVLPDQFQKISL